MEVFAYQRLTQEPNNRKSAHQAHTTARLHQPLVRVAQLESTVRMASLIYLATWEATAQDRIDSFGAQLVHTTTKQINHSLLNVKIVFQDILVKRLGPNK